MKKITLLILFRLLSASVATGSAGFGAPLPLNVSVTNITTVSALVRCFARAIAYNVRHRLVGNPLDNNTNCCHIAFMPGSLPQNNYEVQVQSVCTFE